MLQPSKTISILLVISIAIGGLTLANFDRFEQIIELVQQAGTWGRVVFIFAYAIATLLILPSTAFNLAGGALFGVTEGILLTTVAAIISAILGFALTRYLGYSGSEKIQAKMPQLTDLNQQLATNGLAYTFAARLLPLIPYGIVSFAAGLSQVKRRDYLLGTIAGTPIGLLPYVWLGSAGMAAVTKHDLLPLTLASTLVALVIAAGTFYQQDRLTKYSEEYPDPPQNLHPAKLDIAEEI
ncbi:SNARE associated Golgi protein-like protein [Thalassoporum mexicanum PCC 7367]|uniref:TVP38/TMEM64 family protein n=1 Tax=Thalassoporum mexicanum TaxID=3457544 RepID=UPI00029FAE6E|nr:TVP38/TMEM64 family protein [Pseudanabaena sp. PCC 7367]AFY69347.1 SNARE associated Golgi protein-like protein [Pseudanabaena sp. PCC 7367]